MYVQESLKKIFEDTSNSIWIIARARTLVSNQESHHKDNKDVIDELITTLSYTPPTVKTKVNGIESDYLRFLTNKETTFTGQTVKAFNEDDKTDTYTYDMTLKIV